MKEKQGIFLGHLFSGRREREGFLSCRLPFLSLGEWKRAYMTDDLIGSGPENSRLVH